MVSFLGKLVTFATIVTLFWNAIFCRGMKDHSIKINPLHRVLLKRMMDREFLNFMSHLGAASRKRSSALSRFFRRRSTGRGNDGEPKSKGVPLRVGR